MQKQSSWQRHRQALIKQRRDNAVLAWLKHADYNTSSQNPHAPDHDDRASSQSVSLNTFSSAVSNLAKAVYRNRSPIKPNTITELEHARIPVTRTDVTRVALPLLPEDAQHLCQEARRVAARSKIMPPWIRHLAQPPMLDDNLETIFNHYLADAYPFNQDDVRATHEVILVDRIRLETVACQVDLEGEVVWNEAVHSRVQEVALVPIAGKVKSRNVTTADIHPDYLLPLGPSPDTGSTLVSCNGTVVTGEESRTSGTTGKEGTQLAVQGKRVDYAMVLSDTETGEACRQLLRDINMTHWASCQSINHSEQPFLCHRPIGVSIETKADGAEKDAKLQLSIWVAAHILRLRALISAWNAGSSPGTGSESQLQQHAKDRPISIVLPLLLVSGPRWTLYLARDLGTSIELIHVTEVGSSATFVGCYQLIAMIRVLADWMVNVFRPWFWRHVFLGDQVENLVDDLGTETPVGEG